MNDGLLLNKLLTECNDENSFLYQCYIHSFATSNITESFNKCVDDLKALSDLSYDFRKLSNYAAKYDMTRRDVRQLCEILSTILGETVNELCSNDREFIITKPTCFEDFCPYPKAEIVLYNNDYVLLGNHEIIKHDGYQYEIIDSRAEDTPYYYTRCYLLERKA